MYCTVLGFAFFLFAGCMGFWICDAQKMISTTEKRGVSLVDEWRICVHYGWLSEL